MEQVRIDLMCLRVPGPDKSCKPAGRMLYNLFYVPIDIPVDKPLLINRSSPDPAASAGVEVRFKQNKRVNI